MTEKNSRSEKYERTAYFCLPLVYDAYSLCG